MSTPSTRLPPNPYDQAARFLFRLDPTGSFCWLLAVVRPAFRFAGRLDTGSVPFPGDPERTCDTVADLRELRRSRWRAAFVVEFQARPDRHMLYRLIACWSTWRASTRHCTWGAALPRPVRSAPP